jgi:hypothetical protein
MLWRDNAQGAFGIEGKSAMRVDFCTEDKKRNENNATCIFEDDVKVGAMHQNGQQKVPLH